MDSSFEQFSDSENERISDTDENLAFGSHVSHSNLPPLRASHIEHKRSSSLAQPIKISFAQAPRESTPAVWASSPEPTVPDELKTVQSVMSYGSCMYRIATVKRSGPLEINHNYETIRSEQEMFNAKDVPSV